jgi:serine phosphatase RsbU (regulator of sigma subunit)
MAGRSSPGTCPPGTQCAATGTLRNAARGIGFAGHTPAQLLAGLSSLVAENGVDSFATAAYGRIDPTTGSGSWAAAGHLPFLLLPVDGRPTYLDVPGCPPLGVSGTPTDHTVDLRPGDTLLLYTDGLVERRHENIDRGLARLQSAAAAPVVDVPELADRVVADLWQDLADDCCLLILHRNPGSRSDRPVPWVSKLESS